VNYVEKQTAKAIEFKIDALATLRGPGVYMYCEGDNALYIGASRKVLGRILGRNHHIKSGLESATSLLIFPCASWADAKKLESCMIAECAPKINQRNGAMVRAQSLCNALGMTPQSVIQAYLR
jgi:glyoxylate carboligase